MATVRICFVCLGNICRSPTAEGVMKNLVRAAGLASNIEIASAGTGGWHVGEPADERSRAAARARGILLDGTARQFKRADLARFDYVLAMDRSNQRTLLSMAATEAERGKIHLLRSFDPTLGPSGGPTGADAADVPDPYYGGPEGFDQVLDMCERACRGLLDHLRHRHELS